MKNFSSHDAQAHRSGSARRAEAHRQAGLHAQRSQRWDTAEREFGHATDLAPGDALMWVNLARARMQLGQHVQALAAAQRSFDLDRTSSVACRITAELQLQMSRPAEALATMEALSPEAPRDHDFLNANGNALFQMRRPREAVDVYFKALSLKLDSPLVHYRLGLCFMDMSMAQEAAECFRTAMSLNDPSVRALALSLVLHENLQACNWAICSVKSAAWLSGVVMRSPMK